MKTLYKEILEQDDAQTTQEGTAAPVEPAGETTEGAEKADTKND